MKRQKLLYDVTKVKIQPTPDQEDVLWQLSNQCRLLYNFALAERNLNYQENQTRSEKQYISYVQQANALPELKKKYPNYKWVYSKVLQTTLKTLDNNFRSFFGLRKNGDTDAQPPGFKSKRRFCTLQYNQSGFKIANSQITFSHFYNDVALTFDLSVDRQFANVKQVDIFYDDLKKKSFYLAITHEIQPTRPYVDNNQYQAWDLGVTKHVGVNSAGKFIEVTNARPDKYWNQKIDAVTSQRDHCRKPDKKIQQHPSRGWLRLNAAKRKMERKRSNQIKDFQHKLANKLIANTKATTLIVGDLSVKRMPNSKQATRGLNRATQNTGYLARFIGFLTYKADRVGKKIIKIDERYTTKTCCGCGTMHDMPLSKRVMQCECGIVIDRDRNSAINIMVRFLSQNALWTGYRQFAGNLRQTGLELTRVPVHS
jgi:putative transposase